MAGRFLTTRHSLENARSQIVTSAAPPLTFLSDFYNRRMPLLPMVFTFFPTITVLSTALFLNAFAEISVTLQVIPLTFTVSGISDRRSLLCCRSYKGNGKAIRQNLVNAVCRGILYRFSRCCFLSEQSVGIVSFFVAPHFVQV